MTYPNRIIALDLETTGLNAQFDYITQIAAVVMEDGEIVGLPFYSRVQPSLDKFKVSLGALAVQCGDLLTDEGQAEAAGWFKAMLEAPAPREVALEFVKWLESVEGHKHPVVAHNAAFDMGFMSQFVFQQRTAFGKAQKLCPLVIDTLSLSRLAMPGGASYGLDGVLLACGLNERPGAHDALQDAILCGQVYFKLREMLTQAVTA